MGGNLAKEELLLPDPKPLDPGVTEPDITEGLSLKMTQAMNHYQCEEHHCFMCRATTRFTLPTPEGFLHVA